jgi:hypothetical protein
MGRLDKSRAGELRVLAEKLRRQAREMSLPAYIDMMERAAAELDEEASILDSERHPHNLRPGRRYDIVV